MSTPAKAERLSFRARWDRFWFKRSEQRLLSGFVVAAPPWSPANECEVIWAKLGAALDLIGTHDPRRFQRLQRDIDGIWAFGSPGYLAQWDDGLRLVLLSQQYVIAEATSVSDLASTLVHEGSHAWLTYLGFEYEESRRARLEAICFRCELSFVKRLPDAASLIEQIELQLTREPSFWNDAAFAKRNADVLRELGVPRWLVRFHRWRRGGG